MSRRFGQARFITSAVDPKGYPRITDASGKVLPEIAFLGRSNVGKSSLLNLLLGNRRLAKVSATPGKTQLINFFSDDRSHGFVDLPGYGFANVPDSVRRKWGPMIEGYLAERPSLELLLFLFDFRRDPREDDLQLLEWIRHHNKRVVLVLTKIDKLPKSQWGKRTREIVAGFGDPSLKPVLLSSTKKWGFDDLYRAIFSKEDHAKEA